MFNYVDVIENHTKDGLQWEVCFGNPNPTDENYLIMRHKEDAFKLKNIIQKYINKIKELKIPILTEYIECPWCKNQDIGSGYLDKDEGTAICGQCNKEFYFESDKVYSTEKVK